MYVDVVVCLFDFQDWQSLKKLSLNERDNIWQKNMFSAMPVHDGLNTVPNYPNRHKISDMFRDIDHKKTDNSPLKI